MLGPEFKFERASLTLEFWKELCGCIHLGAMSHFPFLTHVLHDKFSPRHLSPWSVASSMNKSHLDCGMLFLAVKSRVGPSKLEGGVVDSGKGIGLCYSHGDTHSLARCCL